MHTSATTKKSINDKEVNLTPWPAKSPDLNPIQNLGVLFFEVFMQRGAFQHCYRVEEVPQNKAG